MSNLLDRPVWLFDLDGTLVDSSAGVIRAFHAAQRMSQEAQAPAAEIRARIGYPLAETVAQLSGVPFAEFLVPFRREAMATMHLDTILLPGARPLVTWLYRHGRTLALVTSKRADNARRILDYLKLGRHFTALVGADTVTRNKPDPEPIRSALEALGQRARAAVMVGDTWADIAAARDAGVPSIALRSGFEEAARLDSADLVLADARALLRRLEQSRRSPPP